MKHRTCREARTKDERAPKLGLEWETYQCDTQKKKNQ
jgi:hypothetical protein